MTYQHKRDPCSTDTREILQNIFRQDLDSHEIAESKHEKSGVQEDRRKHERRTKNVLPAEAAVLMSDRGESGTRKTRNTSEFVALDRYIPPHEVDFEATEAKEAFEKKKKKRNYLEFSPEYTKEESD